MKKIFLALTATSVFLLSVVTKTHAQAQDAIASAKTGKTTTSESIASASNAKASKMASRALKDFQKSFQDVANADWTATSEGGFVANFTENNVKSTVYYNSNGRWMHTIKRYDEKQLPKDIRQLVRSTYYDYNITSVEEVNVNLQVIYLVHIHGENHSKTLRIADGEMDVIQDLTN
jgi:hypothetical protein